MSMMLGMELLLAGGTLLRPQGVFATSLYTTSGGNQKITNGLDLLGKGGLVWQKPRDGGATDHYLTDTLRGAGRELSSNLTSAETAFAIVKSFASDGVTVGPASGSNVAWSFRRAKKFFDILTYTGDGQSGRQIPHGLGDVPGLIVTKVRDGTGPWRAYHRALGATKMTALNSTAAAEVGQTYWNNTEPTANAFTVGSDGGMNANGFQYVAYLFAHNPDLIDCGSYVGTGSANGPTITCGKGWKPQWLMVKRTDSAGDWYIPDSARAPSNPLGNPLAANLADAEFNGSTSYGMNFTASGFQPYGTSVNVLGGTFVYMAIRSPT